MHGMMGKSYVVIAALTVCPFPQGSRAEKALQYKVEVKQRLGLLASQRLTLQKNRCVSNREVRIASFTAGFAEKPSGNRRKIARFCARNKNRSVVFCVLKIAEFSGR